MSEADPAYSWSLPPVGGMQCNFNRVHAEQGHVFVEAASHLIFRRRHPSQALITDSKLVGVSFSGRIWMGTFQSLVSIMLVHENIVYTQQFSTVREAHDLPLVGGLDVLF